MRTDWVWWLAGSGGALLAIFLVLGFGHGLGWERCGPIERSGFGTRLPRDNGLNPGFLAKFGLALAPLVVLSFWGGGVIALLCRGPIRSAPEHVSQTCAQCGRAVQIAWVACPHCGHKLAGVHERAGCAKPYLG